MEESYADFVQSILKPGEDILATLTPEKVNMWHLATGIAGEAAEVTKAVRPCDSMSSKLIDRENVIEELGDKSFYAQGLMTVLDMEINYLQNVTEQFNLNTLVQEMEIVSGNILDLVKKYVVYNGELKKLDLIRELVKLEVAITKTAFYFGLDREEVTQRNREKLQVRYKGGYSDKKAADRADKVGEE